MGGTVITGVWVHFCFNNPGGAPGSDTRLKFVKTCFLRYGSSWKAVGHGRYL